VAAPLTLLVLLAAAPELPATVSLKTSTESFGATQAVAVREGHLYWKPVDSPDAGWDLFPPDGLPGPTGRIAAIKEAVRDLALDQGFARPTAITQITADGDNLLAIGDGGRAWYAKFSTLTWTDVWGPIGKRGPLKLDFASRAVAMSHRKIPYADIDGNEHPVTAGVTTLYALSSDGRDLFYADPWLPPKFERKICMPAHGTVVGVGLSASASTLFVIDGTGRSFTRLADFDTTGADPALPYSWRREKREGPKSVVRSLPSEDWKEHPRPPGPATNVITILQTGVKNADRELRIEGEGQYWFKKLDDTVWQSKKTGSPAKGQLVDALAEATGPSRSESYTGKASGKGLSGVTLTLSDFDPDCSPAKLTFHRKTDAVEVALHFHDTLIDLKKNVRTLEGALLFPEGGLAKNFLTKDVEALFADAHLEVKLELEKGKLKLKPARGVPGPQKPGAFSAEFSRAKKAP
jgi:hypothetical protein